MKKYFMKGTEDELQFGDMIELNLVKDEDGHKVHSHLECKFIPELVDMLLKNDVIEVVGDEEEEEGLEFADDDASLIDDILEDIENIEKRLDVLEENNKRANKILDKIYEKVDSMIEAMKPVKPKDNAKKQSTK